MKKKYRILLRKNQGQTKFGNCQHSLLHEKQRTTKQRNTSQQQKLQENFTLTIPCNSPESDTG